MNLHAYAEITKRLSSLLEDQAVIKIVISAPEGCTYPQYEAHVAEAIDILVAHGAIWMRGMPAVNVRSAALELYEWI